MKLLHLLLLVSFVLVVAGKKIKIRIHHGEGCDHEKQNNEKCLNYCEKKHGLAFGTCRGDFCFCSSVKAKDKKKEESSESSEEKYEVEEGIKGKGCERKNPEECLKHCKKTDGRITKATCWKGYCICAKPKQQDSEEKKEAEEGVKGKGCENKNAEACWNYCNEKDKRITEAKCHNGLCFCGKPQELVIEVSEPKQKEVKEKKTCHIEKCLMHCAKQDVKVRDASCRDGECICGAREENKPENGVEGKGCEYDDTISCLEYCSETDPKVVSAKCKNGWCICGKPKENDDKLKVKDHDNKEKKVCDERDCLANCKKMNHKIEDAKCNDKDECICGKPKKHH